MRYHTTNKTVYSAKYHLIWCPKYRRRVLVGGVDGRLKTIIAEVAAEVGAQVIEVEVMPDHVHLLAEIPPTVPLSRFIGLVKGRSLRVLRMEFPGCGACRCCGARRGLCPRSVARRWRSCAATWRTRRRWCEVRQ